MILTWDCLSKALSEQVSHGNFFSAHMEMLDLLINWIVQMLPQDMKKIYSHEKTHPLTKGITLLLIVKMDIKVEICHTCLTDSNYIWWSRMPRFSYPPCFSLLCPFDCVGHRQWVGTTPAVASRNAAFNPTLAVVSGALQQKLETNLWQQLSVMGL